MQAFLALYFVMRTFKNPWFTRFAVKEGIPDEELKDMVNQLEAGQADADLGSDVYKIRKARSGAGKSGGYRIIVFFRSGKRTFFHYAYPKSARDNIDKKELRFFKESAKINLNLTDEQLGVRLNAGQWIEF
jgi:hypothetical protein